MRFSQHIKGLLSGSIPTFDGGLVGEINIDVPEIVNSSRIPQRHKIILNINSLRTTITF